MKYKIEISTYNEEQGKDYPREKTIFLQIKDLEEIDLQGIIAVINKLSLNK